MTGKLLTAAGIAFVALLAIGIAVASPLPRFIDAAARDYRAFVFGASSDSVHKIGRDLERLQPLQSHE